MSASGARPDAGQSAQDAAADSIEILLRLLQRASEAHGIHEAQVLGGQYDTEWPRWYAEHMARSLVRDGYRIVRTAS